MELTPAFIIQNNQEKPDKIYVIEIVKANIRSLCPLNQFSKVKSIVFSSNLIEFIPRGAFDKLKDLKELDLSCNFISSFDGIVIPSLIKLVISFNRIETLDWISGYKNLQVLKAEGNKITSMKPLQPLGNLKVLNLSLNQISQIQGISATDIDELYLENNSIEQISPRDIRQSLKILFLKDNQLNDASFLENLKELETLNLDKNEFQTLESFSILPNLNELYLSANQIFMIGNKLEFNELFPVLASLDLSNNSLYDRVELLCLRQLSTLRELNLQGNPCADIENFEELIMEDYPQLTILNDKQILRPTYLEELGKIKDTLKDELQYTSRPSSALPVSKNLVIFDENRIKRDVEEAHDILVQKRKAVFSTLKNIEFNIEKTFYDEFHLIKEDEVPNQAEEQQNKEIDKEDDFYSQLEQEEEKWFNQQLDISKKILERKDVTHRYIKDQRKNAEETKKSEEKKTERPGSKSGTARPGSSSQRKRLEDARNFKA